MNTLQFFNQWEHPDKEKEGVAQTVAILAKERLNTLSVKPVEAHYRIPIGLSAIPDSWVQHLLIHYHDKNYKSCKKFISGQLAVVNNFKIDLSINKVYIYYPGDFYWVAQEDIPEGVEIPRDWIKVN